MNSLNPQSDLGDGMNTDMDNNIPSEFHGTLNEEETLASTPYISPSKKRMIKAAWIFSGIFFLVFFTLLKMPDDRIKGTIDNTINSFLSGKGITYTAGHSKFSMIFGISYTLKDVTVNFPSAPQVHIDQIQIAPSLFPLLLGRMGGSLWVTNDQGSLESSFWIKNSQVSFSFKAKKLNLGKLGILPALASIQGSAVVDGTGSLSGDFNVPNSLDGSVNLGLKQISIDPQSIMGFSIPKIEVSEGTVDLNFDKTKALIKTFKLGKFGENPVANSGDDIQAALTGDLALGKIWPSSNINVKARFTISETIMKAFILLDTILGAGKQPDGSYLYSITGPVTSPMPLPVTPNGGNF